jgi:acyl-homoserine-lactone acylase
MIRIAPRAFLASLAALAAILALSIACARPESASSAAAGAGFAGAQEPARAAARIEAELAGSGSDSGKTVLYRDTWGVPHIYAPTVAAGLYAQGWAQAEDRPRQLLLNLMMGLGELASVVGEQGIDVDVRSHLWDHYGTAERRYRELRPELRAHLEAFAAGINDWYAAHPEDVPEWWRGRQVDPYMVIAFTRLFVYNWSIDEVYGDLERGGIEPSSSPALRGSNQFAIAPKRSAEKAAILAIDPHLAWDGPSRFWEFRIHAGELVGSGTTLAGAPYMGNGHNQTVAWAMTTGGPDTADVYELTLDPDDPKRYRFDGEWRSIETREVTIAVRDRPAIQRSLEFSHHGPILARSGGKAYAAKIAYADVLSLNEAIYDLDVGAGYEGAIRAMESLTFFPQNVMVADTAGHIYYQRTGRVPRRPDGYDWSKPVDGSTSATEWNGFHPASDHLQVLDPQQGWMQNCNIPPDAMMPGSPFQLGHTRDYLFGSREYGELAGWTNQRGARAVELLSADDSVTVEEAMAYINDLEPFGADRWIEALRAADAAAGKQYAAQPAYRAGLESLMEWDRKLAPDSHGALVYDSWRQQIFEENSESLDRVRALAAGIDDWYSVVTGKQPAPLSVSPDDQRVLTATFARAMARLAAEHGEDAAYGDRRRVGRGERSWPLGGGGGDQLLGLTTLRNVGYGAPREDQTRWGIRGQTSTQIVVLSDPPQSWSYLPWGESDRTESPHYTDQADKLFSKGVLKPSWWRPEDLAGHIESRTVLDRAR